MTLDLALITYKPEGIKRVCKMLLPPQDGVRYIVSWQAHEDAPIPEELLKRRDVEVHRFEGTGASKNRNNAIDHCTADIILFADDDLSYYLDSFHNIINTFEKNPDVDLATFRSDHGDMSRFPQKACSLGRKLPKGYFVSAIEMAYRRNSLGQLRCRPELGVASPRFQGGDDEIFLYDAVRQGYNCKFFPITICAHPHESTGIMSTMTKGALQASGVVIALVNPWTAVLRIPLKAWRIHKAGQARFLKALYHLSIGALNAHTV